MGCDSAQMHRGIWIYFKTVNLNAEIEKKKKTTKIE